MTAPVIIDPRAASVRFSNLKLMDRSPAHYYDAIQRGSKEPTLAMRIGSGAHAKLFGTPDIAVYRGGTLMVDKVVKGRKGKKGKNGAPDEPDVPETTIKVPKEYTDVKNGALWEKFQEENVGKLILSDKENSIAENMALAIHRHPDSDRLLFAEGTLHEHRAEWLLNGRRCSGTFDAIGPIALPDLKGVQDASPRRFPFQARKMHYQSQSIWYCDGAELAGIGERLPYLIAVESSPPHIVQVYELDAFDIEDGRYLYNKWLDLLLECERTDIWHGYSHGVLPLNTRGLPPVSEPDEEADDIDIEPDDLDSSSDDIAA